MKRFTTKSWIIAILISAWVVSFVAGFLHGAGILSEPSNPFIHTTRDWIIISVVLIPLSYGLARVFSRE